MIQKTEAETDPMADGNVGATRCGAQDGADGSALVQERGIRHPGRVRLTLFADQPQSSGDADGG